MIPLETFTAKVMSLISKPQKLITLLEHHEDQFFVGKSKGTDFIRWKHMKIFSIAIKTSKKNYSVLKTEEIGFLEEDSTNVEYFEKLPWKTASLIGKPSKGLSFFNTPRNHFL